MSSALVADARPRVLLQARPREARANWSMWERPAADCEPDKSSPKAWTMIVALCRGAMDGWFSITRAVARKTGRRWRQRRYEMFCRLCDVRPSESIIDLGSGGGGALALFNTTNPITAVDLQQWEAEQRPNVTFVRGDARSLPYPDNSFDIAFSNSVIEHLDVADQERFAREVRRISNRYFVQTPNKWFPIEPHYQLPLFQFVPDRAKFWLNERWRLGWQAKGSRETIRLLGAHDLRRLFPDAEIHRERFLGFTKSLMAVRSLS